MNPKSQTNRKQRRGWEWFCISGRRTEPFNVLWEQDGAVQHAVCVTFHIDYGHIKKFLESVFFCVVLHEIT